MSDEVIRLGDHRVDPKAGEVEYELHAVITRTADGRLRSHVEFDEGIKDMREAAQHLRLIVAQMEDRDAEACFNLVIGRDPEPEDPSFPWWWEADWYCNNVIDGADSELCGEDPALRVEILKRVAATYVKGLE